MKPAKEQEREFWEWCGLNEQPSGSWYTDSGEYVFMQTPPIDLNNLFKYAVPKSEMDTLWIINNLDSPTPKIEYCFGFLRGKDNDLICWSKSLPPEECLSPIYEDPADALFWTIRKVMNEKVKD